MRGWTRIDGGVDGWRRSFVPSLRGFGRTQTRHGPRWSRPPGPDRLPRETPYRRQDLLQCLLGAAALFGRMLPRGAHPLRRYSARQPALLRMDSRLDRYLPTHLWRTGIAQPPVSVSMERKDGA